MESKSRDVGDVMDLGFVCMAKIKDVVGFAKEKNWLMLEYIKFKKSQHHLAQFYL
jgi:hypothetical protein